LILLGNKSPCIFYLGGVYIVCRKKGTNQMKLFMQKDFAGQIEICEFLDGTGTVATFTEAFAFECFKHGLVGAGHTLIDIITGKCLVGTVEELDK